MSRVTARAATAVSPALARVRERGRGLGGGQRTRGDRALGAAQRRRARPGARRRPDPPLPPAGRGIARVRRRGRGRRSAGLRARAGHRHHRGADRAGPRRRRDLAWARDRRGEAGGRRRPPASRPTRPAGLRPAHRLPRLGGLAASARPLADFVVLVDARSGEEISTRDVLWRADLSATLFDPNPVVSQGSYRTCSMPRIGTRRCSRVCASPSHCRGSPVPRAVWSASTRTRGSASARSRCAVRASTSPASPGPTIASRR